MGGLAIGGAIFYDYEAAPDGQRFVMFAGAEGTEVAWMNLVSGWFEDLKGRAGSSGD